MRSMKPPVLAKELAEVQLEALDDAEVEGARVERCELGKARAARARFDGVHVSGGTLSESRVDAMTWMDVVCERCDLSLAEWPEAKLTRVVLRDCRATGMRLVDAEIEDARFVGCQLDYAVFSGARFRRVAFEKCKLTGADFGGADLMGAVFDDCELVSVEFGGAKLEGADVDGLVVTSAQAAVLAKLFGLDVRDE